MLIISRAWPGQFLALRGVVGALGEVCRVIADPLQIARDEKQMSTSCDVTLILQHIGDQFVEQSVVRIINGFVCPP